MLRLTGGHGADVALDLVGGDTFAHRRVTSRAALGKVVLLSDAA